MPLLKTKEQISLYLEKKSDKSHVTFAALDSIIPLVFKSEISHLPLVSVAEQVGLSDRRQVFLGEGLFLSNTCILMLALSVTL